jgi:hypothetical protein
MDVVCRTSKGRRGMAEDGTVELSFAAEVV